MAESTGRAQKCGSDRTWTERTLMRAPRTHSEPPSVVNSAAPVSSSGWWNPSLARPRRASSHAASITAPSRLPSASLGHRYLFVDLMLSGAQGIIYLA